MKLIIQTPGVKFNKKLLELIHSKMSKVAHLSKRLIEGRVCLKLNKSDIGENRICEIRVVIPGNDLFTVKQAATFHEAIRKACKSMERQISDWTSNVRHYRKNHSKRANGKVSNQVDKNHLYS